MIYKCIIYIYSCIVSHSQTHPIRDYTLVWMKAHLCLRYNRCAVTSASLVNHLKYEIEIGSYGSCLLFHNRVVCVIILVGTRHTLLTDYAAFYDYTCTLVCYVYSQEWIVDIFVTQHAEAALCWFIIVWAIWPLMLLCMLEQSNFYFCINIVLLNVWHSSFSVNLAWATVISEVNGSHASFTVVLTWLTLLHVRDFFCLLWQS